MIRQLSPSLALPRSRSLWTRETFVRLTLTIPRWLLNFPELCGGKPLTFPLHQQMHKRMHETDIHKIHLHLHLFLHLQKHSTRDLVFLRAHPQLVELSTSVPTQTASCPWHCRRHPSFLVSPDSRVHDVGHPTKCVFGCCCGFTTDVVRCTQRLLNCSSGATHNIYKISQSTI